MKTLNYVQLHCSQCMFLNVTRLKHMMLSGEKSLQLFLTFTEFESVMGFENSFYAKLLAFWLSHALKYVYLHTINIHCFDHIEIDDK